MVEFYEESKGPARSSGRGGYQGGRGGDRGGRGGDRGGRGGRGGFGSEPRQSIVSNTPPGAIKLITNHFKMRVKNSGTISMYTIDFGPTIGLNEPFKMREAAMTCSGVLEKTIGRCFYHAGHIFAMQGEVGDEDFEITSAAEGV